MAEAALFERLQPSLLDRLTDDAPDNQRETRDQRVIDVRRLREIVQRDLSWLLNTYNNAVEIDPEIYPNAARSVLSYGIQDISGNYSTIDRIAMIRRSIRSSIEKFEPRIRPGSLDVKVKARSDDPTSILSFDIHADMWAEPIPMELYLRTDVDLTTGDIAVERQG